MLILTGIDWGTWHSSEEKVRSELEISNPWEPSLPRKDVCLKSLVWTK